MTHSTPAPVACTECGMVCQPAEFHPFAACLMFRGCHDGDKVRANLAALHPQPAPAVAVEADFEPMKSAWPLDRAADMLTAYAELVKAMGRYAEEHYLPEVEQVVEELNALAARSAPAVAEKVPLTVEEVGDLLQDHARYSDEMQDFAREVQSAFAEKNGLRLAGEGEKE